MVTVVKEVKVSNKTIKTIYPETLFKTTYDVFVEANGIEKSKLILGKLKKQQVNFPDFITKINFYRNHSLGYICKYFLDLILNESFPTFYKWYKIYIK